MSTHQRPTLSAAPAGALSRPARPRVGGVLALLLPLALGACAGLHAPAGDAEPAMQQLHSEDRHAAIDELRVRGQTQRLTVQPKLPGAPPYEVLPANRGQDPSQARGASGQRVWSVLSF